MHRARRSVLFCLGLMSLITVTALAQSPYREWHFGRSVNLTFANGMVEQSNGLLDVRENTTCYSDPITGQLLLVSDGVRLLRGNGQELEPGFRLPGGGSSSQGVLIVPQPGTSSIFWVFVANDATDNIDQTRGFWMTSVDLAANGGQGAILVRNQRLLNETCEKVAAMYVCEEDRYVVAVRDRGGRAFRMLDVNTSGVTPLRQVLAGRDPLFEREYIQGYLKFSPSGSKLAMANPLSSTVQLFNFNPFTYELELVHEYTRLDSSYGVAFSKSEEFLYTSGMSVFQLSTKAPYTSTLLGIQPGARGDSTFSAIQRGPDGKMYIADFDVLRAINNPDLAAPACGYNVGNISMTSGRRTTMGLPNCIDWFLGVQRNVLCEIMPAEIVGDLDVCLGEELVLSSLNQEFYAAYRWTADGSEPIDATTEEITLQYDTPGTYTVTLETAVGRFKDTDVVQVTVHPRPTITTQANDVRCPGFETQIIASGGVEYRWAPHPTLSSTSIADPVARPFVPTTYIVTVVDEFGCVATDSITIGIAPPATGVAVSAARTGRVGETTTIAVQQPADLILDRVVYAIDYSEHQFYTPIVVEGTLVDDLRIGTGLRRLIVDADLTSVNSMAVNFTALLARPMRNLRVHVLEFFGCDEIQMDTTLTVYNETCAAPLRNVLFDSQSLTVERAWRSNGNLELSVVGLPNAEATIRVYTSIGLLVHEATRALPFEGVLPVDAKSAPVFVVVESGDEVVRLVQ